MKSVACEITEGLRERGFVHLTDTSDRSRLRFLADSVGNVVSEERIALRPGAHAYVAKPGPVPLHTDHPEVDLIAWLCEEQDPEDGASLLLDSRPVIEKLRAEERHLLHEVELWCPPLSGGPPTMRWPVLRATPRGHAVFCSPWLRSANAIASHEAVLERFRKSLSAALRETAISIRLAPGEAIFVDNRRMLHGRRAIAEGSRRSLHRLWIVEV